MSRRERDRDRDAIDKEKMQEDITDFERQQNESP